MVKDVKNCVLVVFSAPGKLRPKTCPLSILDDFDEALVRRMFRNSCFVVCFLLGNSPASEFYMPTFQNTLFHPHRQVGMKNDGLRMLGYLYRKRFGSKIAKV
jgi:hypothetical protein